MESSELVERCRAGEESAIERFVALFSPALYRLACAVLEDAGEASEAAQDALVAAIAGLRNYSGAAALSTWVYAVALNECRGRLRRRRVRAKLTQVLAGLGWVENQARSGPEDDFVRSEEDKRVWAAVRRLPDAQRFVVVLRYYQELPAREIAAILGISEGTVHSRLNTARRRLHEMLGEQIGAAERAARQEA
jgi:RNA polymerase sigma-70 factor (ECF subfamily)